MMTENTIPQPIDLNSCRARSAADDTAHGGTEAPEAELAD